MSATCRVAVLASGAGSNLTAVVDACDQPDFPATVVLVVSNRRTCGALDIARERGLSDDVLAAFPNAILNIHPSLLPAFGGGMTAVEDALAAGVKVTGCTVHLLAAGAVDGGPIVLQAPVAVHEDDDAGSLRARI